MRSIFYYRPGRKNGPGSVKQLGLNVGVVLGLIELGRAGRCLVIVALHEPSYFSWLLLRKRILIAGRLHKRRWIAEQLCVLCAAGPESCDHLTAACVFIRFLLFCMDGPKVLLEPSVVAIEMWSRLLSLPDAQRRTEALTLLTAIWLVVWTERTDFCFLS